MAEARAQRRCFVRCVLKPDGRVDRFLMIFSGVCGGDFFDLHSAFGARDKHGHPLSRSTRRLTYNSLAMFGPFFDQQPTHFPALWAGLVGDEGLADQFLDKPGTAALSFVILTPPAFPRPPAWICALTTNTGVLSSLAHAVLPQAR